MGLPYQNLGVNYGTLILQIWRCPIPRILRVACKNWMLLRLLVSEYQLAAIFRRHSIYVSLQFSLFIHVWAHSYFFLCLLSRRQVAQRSIQQSHSSGVEQGCVDGRCKWSFDTSCLPRHTPPHFGRLPLFHNGSSYWNLFRDLRPPCAPIQNGVRDPQGIQGYRGYLHNEMMLWPPSCVASHSRGWGCFPPKWGFSRDYPAHQSIASRPPPGRRTLARSFPPDVQEGS